MHRSRIFTMLCALVICFGGLPVQAQESSEYVDFIRAEATFDTMRSYAMVPLALPFERELLQPQLQQVWWANNPELALKEQRREISNSEFVNHLDRIDQLAEKYRIRKIEFSGFTPIGSNQDLDLYFKARTDIGPIMYRFSVSFRDEGRPLLHGIKVFEGFDASRQAIRDVRIVAGDRVASFTYDPAQRGHQGCD